MSDGLVELVEAICSDQFETLADTQGEHDRRVRAFLTMALAVAAIPDEYQQGMTHWIQERIQGLPPIDMINVIHICADAMTTMMALGLGPLSFGGME